MPRPFRLQLIRLLTCIALGAVGMPALAQTTAPTRVAAYDIPAQPLEKALQLVADKVALQILYSPDDLKGLSTRGLRGSYSAKEAIDRLLEGTGLVAAFNSQGAVAIKPASTPGGATQNPTPLAQARSPGAGASEIERTRASTRVEKGQLVLTMPEILVQGSRILNVDIPRSRDDPQPYVVFDRKEIERSGAANIEEFLKNNLPMNTIGPMQSQTASTLGSLSRINLRGLGANQTLILVDGRRISSSWAAGSTQQANLNAIPLSAIERIEVLPTTASGIYGGSATGGVVNIILRRDYRGTSLKVTYDNTFDTDAALRRLDLGAGLSLENGKTNLLLAASISDSNALLTQDRDFIQRGRAAIVANNPSAIFGAANPPLGALPNIRSVNGSPLFGPGTPNFTFVPEGYAGAGGRTPLQANAGQYNLDLSPLAATAPGDARQALANSPQIQSGLLTLRREFSPKLEAFVELAAARTRSHFMSNNYAGIFTLPATAPNNPFGQAIRVHAGTQLEESDLRIDLFEERAATGLILKLPAEWRAHFDYTWNRTKHELLGSLGFSPAAMAAVNNGTLDILRDLRAFPLDFSAFPPLPSEITTGLASRLQDAALRLAGPVGNLPAGRPQLTLSVEHLTQRTKEGEDVFPSFNGRTFIPSRSQQVDSVYLELRAPVFSSLNAALFVRELELQLAGRHDRYETNGSNIPTFTTFPDPIPPVVRTTNRINSTNPTIAVRYVPVQDIALRASYGKGFLPASVDQLTPNMSVSTAILGSDSRRGGEQVLATSIFGGNPDLKPEHSESRSFGVIFNPRFLPKFRLSIDYTAIDKTDNIRTHPLGSQGIINEEALFPERVVRAAAAPGDAFGVGRITLVNNSLLNLARTEVEAYDVQLDYRFDTGTSGTFLFTGVATWQTHFRTQTQIGRPIVENVGITSNNPLKFKGNAGVAWEFGHWSAGWTARHFHSYLASTTAAVLLSQGGNGRVPSQTYHDVFVGYSPPSSWSRQKFLESAELQLGVRNIFNKKPPFDAGSTTFLYSLYGDPRLASYYLSARLNF